MKMYGVEVKIENGKVINATYEGINFYPMKWNAKEHRWEYCIGRYTKEYFRKLLNNGVVRFDYLSIKNGRR